MLSGFESHAFRLGPDGETDIMPRFERGVPGSTPGRGIEAACGLAYIVPSSSGQDVSVTWRRPVVRIHPGLLQKG